MYSKSNTFASDRHQIFTSRKKAWARTKRDKEKECV